MTRCWLPVCRPPSHLRDKASLSLSLFSSPPPIWNGHEPIRGILRGPQPTDAWGVLGDWSQAHQRCKMPTVYILYCPPRANQNLVWREKGGEREEREDRQQSRPADKEVSESGVSGEAIQPWMRRSDLSLLPKAGGSRRAPCQDAESILHTRLPGGGQTVPSSAPERERLASAAQEGRRMQRGIRAACRRRNGHPQRGLARRSAQPSNRTYEHVTRGWASWRTWLSPCRRREPRPPSIPGTIMLTPPQAAGRAV